MASGSMHKNNYKCIWEPSVTPGVHYQQMMEKYIQTKYPMCNRVPAPQISYLISFNCSPKSGEKPANNSLHRSGCSGNKEEGRRNVVSVGSLACKMRAHIFKLTFLGEEVDNIQQTWML